VFKLMMAVMCSALIVALFLAKPDAASIARGILIPSIPEDRGLYATTFILMALIGTEAGSLTNIIYSYFLRQRGWCDPSFRRSQRKDLLLSASSLFIISASTQVAAARTLLPAGISPRNARDIVTMFTQALGPAGLTIFSFGLCAAAFSTMAGATTGYALIAKDVCSKIWTASGRGRWSASQRPWVAFWCFAPLPLMAVTERPVWLVLFVSSLMAACIPVLALFLLLLTSDRRRMGPLANGRTVQFVFVLLITASTALLFRQLLQVMEGALLR
jgi:Mn2+/Fe2+ NRAMP family transporter